MPVSFTILGPDTMMALIIGVLAIALVKKVFRHHNSH